MTKKNQRRRPKAVQAKGSSPRPFRNDYAGIWPGHCLTRESAIKAAIAHVVSDGYTKCTITNVNTGERVASVRLDRTRTVATVEVEQPFKTGPGPAIKVRR